MEIDNSLISPCKFKLVLKLVVGWLGTTTLSSALEALARLTMVGVFSPVTDGIEHSTDPGSALSIDITYDSMAKAFNQELVYHEETKRRMSAFAGGRKDGQNRTPEQIKARDRMALFPDKAEVLFVDPELWVVRIRNTSC